MGGQSSFGKPASPPPAPNYPAAASAQGAANVSTAEQQSRLSNPNIYTPYGSQTIDYGQKTFDKAAYEAANQQRAAVGLEGVDPSTFWNVGQPTITQNLTPAGQKLFDINQQTQLGLGGLANQGIGQVQGALGRQFDPALPGQVSSLGQGNFHGGPAPTTTGTPQLNPGALPQASFSGQNDPVTQAIVQRNQPFAERQRTQLDTQLRNQGLVPGGEAYSNAMSDFGRQQNDFNLAAIQAGAQEQQALFGQQLASQGQGFGQQLSGAQLGLGAQGQQFGQQTEQAQMGNQAQLGNLAQQQAAAQFQNQARQQAMQEAAYRRSLPLNEISALMSGSQVQAPQFQPYSGTVVGQTPIFGAAQAQGQYNQGIYNQQMAGQNAMTSGIFGLGGALGSAYMLAPAIAAGSDRRIKENIVRIGTHPRGFGIYRFSYKPEFEKMWGEGEHIGVMADEVELVIPGAVTTLPSGYKAVYYGRL